MVTLISGVFGLLLAALLLYLVRKDHLHISHGLAWTFAIVMCALLGFAPGIFDALAITLGVSYPPILGIAIALAAIVIKALLTDIELSKMKVRHLRLAQKVAILESELRELTVRPPIDD